MHKYKILFLSFNFKFLFPDKIWMLLHEPGKWSKWTVNKYLRTFEKFESRGLLYWFSSIFPWEWSECIKTTIKMQPFFACKTEILWQITWSGMYSIPSQERTFCFEKSQMHKCLWALCTQVLKAVYSVWFRRHLPKKGIAGRWQLRPVHTWPLSGPKRRGTPNKCL